MGLAEQLGRILAGSKTACPTPSRSSTRAAWPAPAPGILTLSVLKGLFAEGTTEPGVVRERAAARRRARPSGPRGLDGHGPRLREPGHPAERWPLGGGLPPAPAEPRLVMLDDHTVEVPPAPHMVVVRNDDRPGMIGVVGTILGDAGVSISSMAVGPSATGNTALMVLSTATDPRRRPAQPAWTPQASATSTPSGPDPPRTVPDPWPPPPCPGSPAARRSRSSVRADGRARTTPMAGWPPPCSSRPRPCPDSSTSPRSRARTGTACCWSPSPHPRPMRPGATTRPTGPHSSRAWDEFYELVLGAGGVLHGCDGLGASARLTGTFPRGVAPA